MTKMAKIDTLFMTKTAEKPYPIPFGAAHAYMAYMAYIRETPPPPGVKLWHSDQFNAGQIELLIISTDTAVV